MGNTVCEFNRVFDAMCDAVCCCQGNGGNNKRLLSSCCLCLQRSPRNGNHDDGFRDNYGDVQCAYNDDYTIDTVCIQGQAMILPPNESTIEPFIADIGGSMGEADLRENRSLGGNVIYKQPQQPLNVGLLQYHTGQDRPEQHSDIR